MVRPAFIVIGSRHHVDSASNLDATHVYNQLTSARYSAVSKLRK
jgi:hypothetical protein